MSTAEPALRTEQEVLGRFNELRQGVAALASKLGDIEAEAAEHDLVIKQLEPMDRARKCYRMIGDVLVERTVAETLPAVQRNRDGLGAVMKQLDGQLQAQQKALAEFVARYKIRAVQPGEEQDGPAAGSKPGSGGSSSKAGASEGSSKAGAGVLV